MKNKAINIIIIIGAIFVSFYFGGIKGVQKERDSNICVHPYEIRNWERSIEVVETVYKHVISTFSDDLAESNRQIERWRDSYFILKRQSEIELAKELNK